MSILLISPHTIFIISFRSIVSFTHKYSTDAAAAHAVGKPYFLGETNSGMRLCLMSVLNNSSHASAATCGGGGISPTFGAGLWVMDYVIQAALAGVDRSYFHHGTLGNCVSWKQLLL